MTAAQKERSRATRSQREEAQTANSPGGVGNWLHPDRIAGGLTRILQQVSNPVSNTLGDIGVYLGLAQDELLPAPHQTPTVTITPRWQLPGLVSEDLVFRSLHQPLEPKFRRRYEDHYSESHLVYARRIRPGSARRRPRLLYLHGYMQPETYFEEFTLLASMAIGLNVEIIQMQPPHHGRRTVSSSRYSGEFYWSADLVRSVESLRQTILDARTLLGWLQEQDERPVGLAGLSLGGALTLSLSCIEDRFAFAIPVIAHMDLAALVSDAPVLSGMRQDLKSFGWGRKEFDRFIQQIGWDDLQPKLPPDNMLMIAASNDRFFDPKLVERLWERWGKPAIEWYPTSHMGFLPYLPGALRRMRTFIDERAEV